MTANRALTAGLTLSRGQDPNATGTVNFGAYTYTLIMFCPILSHLAIKNSNSPINGKQPSGLVSVVTGGLTEEISMNTFFGLNELGTVARGADDYMSTNTLYGLTSNDSLEAFVYSARID